MTQGASEGGAKRRPLENAFRSAITVPPWAIYIAAAVTLVLTVWLYISPPQHRFTIAKEAIGAETGFAHIAPVPDLPGWEKIFLRLRADDIGVSESSALILTEDGRRLGPSHSAHDDIRNRGEGRYSHWGKQIYFSASDNSDPTENGRRYEASARLDVPLSLVAMTLLLTSVSLLLLARSPAVRPLAHRVAKVFLWPADYRIGPIGFAVALAFIGALAAWFMLSAWREAATGGVSFVSFFPVSDAKGHYECSQTFIDFDRNLDWCHRRPIYSVFLAGLSFILGRDLGFVHIAQSAMMLAASALFAREIGRWLGVFAALGVFTALVVFAKYVIFGHTLTEVFGLTVGLIGQTVLLRAANIKSIRAAAFGVFLVSAALSARPGGVLVLGFLILFVAWMAAWSPRKMLIAGGAALGATIAGIALHSVCMIIVHGDLGGSFGNFSLTMYGLSVGKDWSSATIDHPELMGENAAAYNKLYQLAFANFAAHPEVLLKGLWSNFIFYTTVQWNSWMPVEGKIRQVLWVISLLAMIGLATKSRRGLLVLAMMLGEMASSLLIARDGEARVFVATMGGAQIAALFPAFVLAARALTQRLLFVAPAPMLALTGPRIERAPAVFAGFIGLMIALSGFGVVHLAAAKKASAAPACPAGLEASVIVLSKGGSSLWLDDSVDTPQTWPWRLSREDFIAEMQTNTWYYEDSKTLPEGQIVQADDLLEGRPEIGAFYAPRSVTLPYDKRIALCVDESTSIMVAGASYHKVVSAQPLP